MTQAEDGTLLDLLGDLSRVSQEYRRQVGSIKRFLERWTMDPAFRTAFGVDPEGTIAALGVALRVDEVMPFVDDDQAIELTAAIRARRDADYPASVRRYRAFYREKRLHRREIRQYAGSSNPTVAAWRARQVARCVNELGVRKADAIVHAPAAIELAKGCTVGCWFCGVDASRFEGAWPYDESNGALWRASLGVLRDVIGDCAKQAFLYWATDPLDNPDYERFLTDFHAVLGRCPQTTTAKAAKDVERTRRLLELSHSLGSTIDRFSIINLDALRKVHAAFAPEELLRVECIPQNREAADRFRKANAGRARTFAAKRGAEMMPSEAASTIACVSGFLFNMVERSVQLVTPCNADHRWPLGYWVIDRRTFESAEDLRSVLEAMIERHMPTRLRAGDPVRIRPTTEVSSSDGDLVFRSQYLKMTFHGQPAAEDLAQILRSGEYTAAELALCREARHGVPLEQTFLLLDDIFRKGLIDEEPQPQAEPSERMQVAGV